MKNDVWEIVAQQERKLVVDSRWLYKVKHATDGTIDNYKSKFIAWGFFQRKGIDYGDAITPVARFTFIKFIISLALVFVWYLRQIDVNNQDKFS